jgi:hypothetical protein
MNASSKGPDATDEGGGKHESNSSQSGGERNIRNYAVGYGRPPIATRFKSGGIGNPKGRPKKKRTVGEDLEGVLMTRVMIEDNGRPKTMTLQAVILRNLARTAARGNSPAIRTLFALRERYRDSPDTTLNPADLESEDRKILEQYLAMLSPKGSKDTSDTESDSNTNRSNTMTGGSSGSGARPSGKPEGSEGDAS